jgi:hypothetical protein
VALAVLNFMVAEQYRQEPSLVASLELVGNMMAAVHSYWSVAGVEMTAR